MKKVLAKICSLAVIALLFTTSTVNAQAKQTNDELTNTVISKKVFKEEKDLHKLFDKAAKGISDVPMKDANKSIIKNLNTSEQVPLNTLKTVQLIESENYKDGKVKNSYALTYFADVNEKNLTGESDESFSTMGSGNYEETPDWDKTGGVRAYGTIYYFTENYSGEINRWKITRAKGGWNSYDSTIAMSNRSLEALEYGYQSNMVIPLQYNDTTNLSTNTYDIYYGFNYIYENGDKMLATKSKVTLSKAGSSWTFEFDCELP
ncbi:hypothetical protein [Desulfosporosinus meridiei]|uniref:Uncharacterized protein n=1 Tax=Desulfosporosinus meridiei (strain ATCC BAA-275 / DSM 13257 / KCTC 12902 / NCIMB 13706 / S10) TaxID=768704 RepID=J7IU79_DESMD|nr:hypothetical protein [Desulfosporosinus meridiei]AFQ42241.1 hypothetical protein Desmer_0174 [Desulfosporosinus meridiei DSM 13257]